MRLLSLRQPQHPHIVRFYDISDLRRNVRRGDFRRLPSWVSDDARDLISSMLIVRPQKRATITEVRAH